VGHVAETVLGPSIVVQARRHWIFEIGKVERCCDHFWVAVLVCGEELSCRGETCHLETASVAFVKWIYGEYIFGMKWYDSSF
jgi:hypothetical protein